MTDGTGTSSYGYDSFGELISAENGNSKTVDYAYDALGNVTGVTYPLGGGATWANTDTVSYLYDKASQMTAMTDFNGNTVQVSNTKDGLPSSLSLGGSGDIVSTTYDPTDSPSDVALTSGDATLLGFSYSDEPSGGVAAETDTPSSDTSPADYTYDAQSRVTEMTPGSDDALSYTEDDSDNLTKLPTGASTTYDYGSELTSSTLSATTTDYSYDADGDRTGATQGMTTIVSAGYNGAKELTSYSNSAADMTAVTYDGDGVRASATSTPTGGGSSTSHFVWDENGSVPALLMDSTNAYIYGPSGTPIEQVNLSSGTVRYLVSDALGSVRGVVSSAGSLTASTSYDAWGNPETTGGLTSYTPFGFAGGYTDPTGLVYLIHRYFDPSTGQFLSVDPLVDQTGQPYAYVNDNPVSGTDPLGLGFGLGTITGALNWANRTLNPGYLAWHGYNKEYQAARNGCSLWTVAEHGAEGVLGVASTALAVTGVGEGVNALRGAAGAGSLAGEAADQVPQEAESALEQIDQGRWPPANSAGMRGGGTYANSNGALPATDSAGNPVSYQEWDVNPKTGSTRDAQRIVTGSDGSAYYTGNHYGTFVRIR